MLMGRIITVAGQIAPQKLGRTLVHEHMHLAMAGWEADTLHPVPTDAEVVAKGVAMWGELRRRGYDSFIDPLPGNMGRRLDLVAEIAARSGVNIVCATGLFTEENGATPYWKGRFSYLRAIGQEDTYVRYLADLFVNEIENGSGPEKIRCGIIKVASGTVITDYERATLKAAALAAVETDTPITTHSDNGLLGEEQQRVLLSLGVPAHKIIIGHSCNTTEHRYHRCVVDHGSFIAFDRFGYLIAQPDENRIDSMLALIDVGGIDQVLVSNDGVCNWRDTMQPAPWGEFFANQEKNGWSSLHFHDTILPELRRRGLGEDAVEKILVANPRRVFTGEAVTPARVEAHAAAAGR
jgi:phosphotriesterase-related protein